MATIYSAPQEILEPKFDPNNLSQYRKDEEKYINEVVAFAKKQSYSKDDKHAGEMIRIPQGDGYACYVVFTTRRPVGLIHLRIGDCWHSPLAEKLNKKDILRMIEGEKMINKLFGKI